MPSAPIHFEKTHDIMSHVVDCFPQDRLFSELSFLSFGVSQRTEVFGNCSNTSIGHSKWELPHPITLRQQLLQFLKLYVVFLNTGRRTKPRNQAVLHVIFHRHCPIKSRCRLFIYKRYIVDSLYVLINRPVF